MNKKTSSASDSGGIPISISMEPLLEEEGIARRHTIKLTRLLYICSLAILNALLVSVIAKVMVALINLVTGISFYGTISTGETSPVGNHLGIWVIFIPVIGGIIVGIMARFGSAAIRGHGIPEAMEQVLTNQSKINPIVTLLKPISAAFSIGTGGPFGAEGPIISAGGAFGSLIGQILRITGYERKILLTAGATAGMAAIFGSPVAAIMLAIELLLFEFSPRSIIPVALACITGAAGHIFFFGIEPMFAMPAMITPSIVELIIYVVIGTLVGVLSVGVTKIVYAIEDGFEKLPVHWMWWPAMGGLAVGIIGYFAPSTMGVGYDNIRGILSGHLAINTLLIFCFLKFLSWSISLGSGTSGGTLAPLFTIGGAMGALIAIGINYLFPSIGLSLPAAGLIGMAAMFSGASRAFLTSIIFALETTQEPHMLLPLLGGCAAAYFVSFVMMKSTIMTEKIARRGINTPESYVPDILNSYKVGHVLKEEVNVLGMNNTIGDARKFILENDEKRQFTTFAIVDEDGDLYGIIGMQEIFNKNNDESEELGKFAKTNPVSIYEDEILKSAVDKMLAHNLEILPIVSRMKINQLVGILSYRDILEAYELREKEAKDKDLTISIRKQSIRIIIKGRRLFGNS
ncbi:MAG TPA: chloride channel protein [Bacteroidia bacterium]|nr:chloride channel protein [Bacteroidia bacterium]